MKRGTILPLVILLTLVLSFFLTTLLKLPGFLNNYTMRKALEIDEIYKDESAIILALNSLPQKAELPQIEKHKRGPYLEFCAKKICATTIEKYRDYDYRDWSLALMDYEKQLQLEILSQNNLEEISGNKRIFSLDTLKEISLKINHGDLLFDINDSCKNLNFFIEGSARFRGNFRADTLRIFAKNEVEFKGNIQVKHLEIITHKSFFSEGEFIFRGLIFATEGNTLKGKSEGLYPSFLLAFGVHDAFIKLEEKTKFSGFIWGNILEFEDKNYEKKDVLPSFFEGENLAFKRSFKN